MGRSKKAEKEKLKSQRSKPEFFRRNTWQYQKGEYPVPGAINAGRTLRSSLQYPRYVRIASNPNHPTGCAKIAAIMQEWKSYNPKNKTISNI